MITYSQALAHIRGVLKRAEDGNEDYGKELLARVYAHGDRMGVSFYPLPLWLENEIRYYGVKSMRSCCGNRERGCEREMERYNGVAEGEAWWDGRRVRTERNARGRLLANCERMRVCKASGRGIWYNCHRWALRAFLREGRVAG